MKYLLLIVLFFTGCASTNICHKYCLEQGDRASGYFNGQCSCYNQPEDVWKK